MIEKIRAMKNKKGFTLVELIVVLVILAILAALLIPALTGYIDKAKNQAIISETRMTVMAAQTLVDEAYGKKDVGATVTIGTDAAKVDVTNQAIADLAEVPVANIGKITFDTTNTTKIATLKYNKGNKTCTYTANPTGTTEKYVVGEKSSD